MCRADFKMVASYALLFICAKMATVSAAENAKSTAKNTAPQQSIEHKQQQIEGWTVEVDTALLSGEHKPLGDHALRILKNKLYEISQIVAVDRVKKLREVPIFLDRQHPLDRMQYHPDQSWLRDHNYDDRMTRCVHIPRADQLIHEQRTNTMPYVVLHELAHAYHDRVLGFDEQRIVERFDQVVAEKKYESVLRINGKQVRHYALTNHKEFFAEMTEAYFGANDFYPFVRAELRQTDPATYNLLETIWGRAH